LLKRGQKIHKNTPPLKGKRLNKRKKEKGRLSVLSGWHKEDKEELLVTRGHLTM